MASLLSVGGLSTGIDTKALIDQLIYADRSIARLAESKKAQAQVRLDAIKSMNTRLLAARDGMDAIKQGSTFAPRKATSSNEAVLTATATTSATASGMVLNVKRLASTHQVATSAKTSASDPQGTTGSITIRAAGATSDTVVALTNYSLNGIATAINGANAGVTAAVVNDGTGYRLLVTSTKSGEDNAITTLAASGDLAGLLPSVGGLTQVSAGLDAQVRIGDPTTGLLVESATNTLDQAIPGVTLNLKAVGDGVNLTVTQDAATVRGSVQKTLDALNDARAYYASNAKYNVDTKTAGALFSEYDLARQLDSVERALTKTYTSQPTGFQSLAEIGVTVGTDGKFTINATKFDAKLAENQSAVSALFLAAGGDASVPLEGLTRSVDGAMALKQSGLEESIKSYTERITTIDERLVIRRAFYEKQFLEMEKITAQLQSQGSSMTNFISSLNGTSAKK